MTPTTDKLAIPEAVELLPCPLCNARAQVEELGDDDSYYVSCTGCGLQQIAKYHQSAAIVAWNRRIPHMPDRGYAEVGPTHRHKKRGSEYVLLGFGKMQSEDWRERDVFHRKPDDGSPVYHNVDMREVAIYRSVDDGSLWARPREEFEDGRFEALATPAPADNRETIQSYFERQIGWSHETFGPALRTKGVIDHIRKELTEIEAKPHDLSEWIDVVILAMDGFWRHGGAADGLLPALLAKQQKNMARNWPDWRLASEDKAIEHDRSGEAIEDVAGSSEAEVARLREHKWFSPECAESGCRSLILEHEVERLKELNDKYIWQVRDTCTRAEKAEADLAAAESDTRDEAYREGYEEGKSEWRGVKAQLWNAMQHWLTLRHGLDDMTGEGYTVSNLLDGLSEVEAENKRLSDFVGRQTALAEAAETTIAFLIEKFVPPYEPWMDDFKDDDAITSFYRGGSTYGDLRRTLAARRVRPSPVDQDARDGVLEEAAKVAEVDFRRDAGQIAAAIRALKTEER